MFNAIGKFTTGFFRNVKADPVSTLKGLTQLAAAGAAAYGMANGTVPINEASIGFVGAMAASGVHAIGTDNTTSKEETAAPKEVVNQLSVMKEEADNGQKKINEYTETVSAIHSLINRQ